MNKLKKIESLAKRLKYPQFKIDDILQDTHLMSLTRPKSVTQNYRYTLIDTLRNGIDKRRPEHVQLTELSNNDNPLSSAMKREQTYNLVNSISTLEAREIKILILHLYCDWSLKEISLYEKLSERRIRELLESATACLKKELK